LRRKGISEDPSKFGSLLTRAGMGLVNLFSFAPLQIETISFRDNRDFGYMVSANMRDGNIEVNQNQNWVSAISRCVDQRCIMENQMKIENMPSDAELILLANDFLKKHGIKLENFGEPVIDSTWRGEYEKMAVKTDAWIPEIVSVAYPIKVKGTLVNDLSGGKVSLQVNINAREQKVTGMYNLWAQNYDVSKYDAITDSTKILAIANQGGYYGVPVMEGGEVIEIDLGTPTKVYAHIMNYNSTGYDNLLVPSLLFPVIKTPAREDYHFPENIIVPLAKDLVSYQSISIMREPMMLEGVSATMPPSEGSAPSSGKME